VKADLDVYPEAVGEGRESKHPFAPSPLAFSNDPGLDIATEENNSRLWSNAFRSTVIPGAPRYF
jgi:hypothetical protein